MLLPGRPTRGMVVTVTLAKATVLDNTGGINNDNGFEKMLVPTCFPTEVRPRASRRLWTGLVIQLILGSRRICMQMNIRKRAKKGPA